MLLVTQLNNYSKCLDFANVYYRPQRSWGKVIFSQASVILSTGGGPVPGGPGSGGVPAPGGVPALGGVPGPRGGAWSWRCLVETPLGRLLLRVVRILLESILVQSVFTVHK